MRHERNIRATAQVTESREQFKTPEVGQIAGGEENVGTPPFPDILKRLSGRIKTSDPIHMLFQDSLQIALQSRVAIDDND
jgi:hypothetical protein